MDWYDFLGNVVAAFAGALVGAYSAFRLEVFRENLAERDEQIAAGRRALFALLEQCTFTYNLNSQFLERMRKAPELAWTIPTPFIAERGSATLDTASLGFLLEAKRSELLYRLATGEARFRDLQLALRERAKLNLDFQQQIERQLQGTQVLPPPDKLAEMSGPRMFRQLSDLTNEILLAAAEAMGWNRDNAKALREALQERFPKAHFFQHEPYADPGPVNTWMKPPPPPDAKRA